MHNISTILFLVTTLLISGCNENKEKEHIENKERLEKENIELKKKLEEKDTENKEQLEKENMELKNTLAQKKERFYYIKDTVKVDIDSIMIDANADLYYNIHVLGDSGRMDTIITVMLLCDEAAAYMVSVDSPRKVNTDNFGPEHKFSIENSGHASYVYKNHCYFNNQL